MEKQVKEVAMAMKDINLLSSYELSKEKVLAYAEKLVSLYPKIEAKMVEDLMTDFFVNTEEYMPTKGIRNFTEHLEKRNVRGETPEEICLRKRLLERRNLRMY